MERNDEMTERRVADRRAVAVAGSDPMREALTRIARWHGEFPETGKFWPNGSPTSYAAEHGSYGERDYMRQVALDALAAAPQQVDAVQAVPEALILAAREVLSTELGEMACLGSMAPCEDALGKLEAALAALASPSPAVPPDEPTKDRITEIAAAMAVKVAKNAGTVPQLCFPDIYLDLTELFAGQVARGAVPEGWKLVPLIPTAEMLRRGGHMNSEWLNDDAPIGECRYHPPIGAIWADMLAAAPLAQPTDTTAGE